MINLSEAWENKKVRQAIIIIVSLGGLWYIAENMGSDSTTDYSTLKKPKSAIFGMSQSSENMSVADTEDIIERINAEMAEKERDFDLKTKAKEKENAEMQQQLQTLQNQFFEMQNQLKAQQTTHAKVKSAGNHDTARGVIQGSEQQVELINTQSNLVRKSQTNILTQRPQIQGKVIRTITQRKVREIRESGVVEEKDVVVSSLSEKNTRVNQSGGNKKDNKKKDVDSNKVGSNGEFTLAMGSIISGTSINGVAAPTSIGRQNNPVPVLLRIKREAVMPNYYTLDIRECHMLASAIGELSSERVMLRAEGISCITEDGQAIEKNITAYAVSSTDGLAGVKGTIVSRTKEMLSNSLLAGFVGGFAKAATPNQVRSVNTEPGATSIWESAKVDQYAGAGILQGGASAAERVADYYMSMVEQTWPVVELLPGIQIDFIVQKGMTLKLETSENNQ